MALDCLEAPGIEDDLVVLLEHPEAPLRREAVISLARRGDVRVTPAAQALCGSEQPEDRALGLFVFYHLAVAEGLVPALAALADPHPTVRGMARYVLLRTAGPERAAALQGAIRGLPGLSAEGALGVALDLGGEEGLVALPQDADLPPEQATRLAQVRERVAEAPALNPDYLPRLRRPLSLPAPLPPHWQLYWADACQDPQALRWHDGLCNRTPIVADTDWLTIRDHCLAHPTLRWLLRDLSDDAEGQVRTTVAAYLGADPTAVPASLWLKAWQIVSPSFLQKQWWRGRAGLALASPEACHALLAVSTLYADLLVSRSADKRLVQELLTSDDAQLMAHWRRLTSYTNAYWGLALKPAIPLARFVRFVHDHWRKLRSAQTPEGATAREILDYLCLQCTLQPGTVAWRDHCKEALWEALVLVRDNARKTYQRASVGLADRLSAKALEAVVRTAFDQALATYDPFWSGPEEPLFPVGDLTWRSRDGKLPKTQYGRGIPFIHYFHSRLSVLLSGPEGQPFETIDPHLIAESDDLGARPKPEGAPRRHCEEGTVVDDDGTVWVTLRWLATQTGLTEAVLRGEDKRGFLHFSRRKGMRVLRKSEVEAQGTIAELQARDLLRSPSRLTERFDASRRTIQRHVTDLRPGRSALETLRALADRVPRRAAVREPSFWDIFL